jgi:RHS repeat-associated protein
MNVVHKAMGPATALRVQAGDKVEMEAWVRYKTKPTYHRHMTPLLMGQLLSGTYAGLGVFEGYTASQAAPLFESLAAAMQGTGEEDDRPFAYLNFALFAHDMSLLDAGWERIPEEAGFASGEESLPNRHKRVAFSTPVVVPEDGFIYIWLSNESEGTEVWFDDLSIRHTQTLVAQATDYGVWGEVLREQRSDARKYRYGYQSLSRLSGRQFAEKDEETGWNHFELRQYDPIVGMWLSIDPYRQYHSPYVGMGNNPVSGVDPDGGKFLDIIFQNNNGQEIGRIINGDPEHQYIQVPTDFSLKEPIKIDISQLNNVDAVGFGVEAGFTFGGGMVGGFEWVYFLNGPDAENLFRFGKIGGNLGFEGGAGIYGFFAYNNLNDPKQITAKSWEGVSNSYSGGYGNISGGYFWGNKQGTAELFPGHKGKTAWEGWHIMGGFSPGYKFGAKWSSAKYTLLSD